MFIIADVIVDVPTMQTDQPFSYIVPENLKEVIAIGMRVEVPFGNGNRHIQGFIVGLRETIEVEQQLKPIISVLDLHPVLNTELLALADEMKETIISSFPGFGYTFAIVELVYFKSVVGRDNLL